MQEVSVTRIQSLLHLAIQTSTLSTDPNKEELTCTFASHNLIQHLHLIQSAGESLTLASTSLADKPTTMASTAAQGLKGIEALTLDYHVAWPLSIVLSRRAITKYQLLSRLLYFSKHVERRVLSCWQDHQSTRPLSVRGALGPSYCLRHRMLHFLQNFVYYMTFEVINPRSHEMAEDLTHAGNIDEMLSIHEKFLDVCLKECLLASQDLLRILTKIMTTCLLFADNMKRFTQNNEVVEESPPPATAYSKRQLLRQIQLRERAEYIQKETSHESYLSMLAKLGQTFDTQASALLCRRDFE